MKIPIEWFYVMLAAMGGAAHYLQQYINGNPFRIGLFLANVVLSGFSGLMFAIFGQSIALPQDLLYVLAGVGGFMGANTLEFLSKIIKARTNL